MHPLVTEDQDENENQCSQSSRGSFHNLALWLLMALEVVRREPGFPPPKSHWELFQAQLLLLAAAHTQMDVCLMKGF